MSDLIIKFAIAVGLPYLVAAFIAWDFLLVFSLSEMAVGERFFVGLFWLTFSVLIWVAIE